MQACYFMLDLYPSLQLHLFSEIGAHTLYVQYSNFTDSWSKDLTVTDLTDCILKRIEVGPVSVVFALTDPLSEALLFDHRAKR